MLQCTWLTIRLEGRPSGVAVAMHMALGSGIRSKLAASLNLQQRVIKLCLQEQLVGNTTFAKCACMMHYAKHTQHACNHYACAMRAIVQVATQG